MNVVVQPSLSLLQEIKLLRGLNDFELQQILTFGKASSFEAHSNIVIEGEMSWGVYLILSGTVRIFKANKLTGESYDVGQLGSGSFFGEMSLIDNNPRSATVKALTDCQVFFISKEALQAMLKSSPAAKIRFYENCVQSLVGRLRELDDNYVTSQYQLWKMALTTHRKREAA